MVVVQNENSANSYEGQEQMNPNIKFFDGAKKTLHPTETPTMSPD